MNDVMAGRINDPAEVKAVIRKVEGIVDATELLAWLIAKRTDCTAEFRSLLREELKTIFDEDRLPTSWVDT